MHLPRELRGRSPLLYHGLVEILRFKSINLPEKNVYLDWKGGTILYIATTSSVYIYHTHTGQKTLLYRDETVRLRHLDMVGNSMSILRDGLFIGVLRLVYAPQQMDRTGPSTVRVFASHKPQLPPFIQVASRQCSYGTAMEHHRQNWCSIHRCLHLACCEDLFFVAPWQRFTVCTLSSRVSTPEPLLICVILPNMSRITHTG